jgi:hypothetical protein
MTLYQPIRDTFEELNRQLLDRREFDARQKKAEVDEGLRNTMLKAQLDQRAWDRDMTQRKLEDQMKTSKIQRGLAQARIDTEELNQQIKQDEVNDIVDKAKMVEFSVRDMLGNDYQRFIDNPESMKRFLSSFGPEGSVDFENDRVVDMKTRKPVRRSKNWLAEEGMALTIAHRSGTEDMTYEHAKNVKKLTEKTIPGIEKQIRDSERGLKEGAGIQAKGMHKVRLEEAKKSLRASEEALLPKSRYEYWKDKEEDLREAARYTSKWPEQAKQFRADADAAGRKAELAMKEHLALVSAGTKGTDATQKGFQILRDTITPMQEGFTGSPMPNQTAAATMAERYFINAKENYKGKWDFGTSAKLANDVMKTMEEKHNAYLAHIEKMERELTHLTDEEIGDAIAIEAMDVKRYLGYIPTPGQSWIDMISQQMQ